MCSPAGRKCDEQLAPVVKSVLYAAGRVDVPELLRIKEHLVSKYGRDWAEQAAAGADPRLVFKLGIRNPDNTLVNKYLLAIAEIHSIAWAPEEEPPAPLVEVAVPAPVNAAHPPMQATPLYPPQPSYPPAAADAAPPPPYSENPSFPAPAHSPVYHNPQAQRPAPVVAPTALPPPPAVPAPAGSPNFDDLAKRFEALKGKR